MPNLEFNRTCAKSPDGRLASHYPSQTPLFVMPLLLLMIVTLSLASFGATAQAAEPDPCLAFWTTSDRRDCRIKQISIADEKLEKYVKTVKTRARDLGLDALKISKEQSAWERYRGEHCGNVYLKWKQGTIRYEMEALCNLKLTRDRTWDVWFAYLRFPDSTPPLLPDPNQ